MHQGQSARAQKNPEDGKCWGTFSRHIGYCEKRCRKGMLTCWWHANCEFYAQLLKKRLDKENQSGEAK